MKFSETYGAFKIKGRRWTCGYVPPLSDTISRLTELWLDWMKYNRIANDESIPLLEREAAASKCEELITEEYELVAELDKYFE